LPFLANVSATRCPCRRPSHPSSPEYSPTPSCHIFRFFTWNLYVRLRLTRSICISTNSRLCFTKSSSSTLFSMVAQRYLVCKSHTKTDYCCGYDTLICHSSGSRGYFLCYIWALWTRVSISIGRISFIPTHHVRSQGAVGVILPYFLFLLCSRQVDVPKRTKVFLGKWFWGEQLCMSIYISSRAGRMAYQRVVAAAIAGFRVGFTNQVPLRNHREQR